MQLKGFITLLCLILWGCNHSSDLPNLVEDYQQRLANILEQEPPKSLKVSLAPYPNLNALKLDTPQLTATNIKLFEFYKLKHCKLYSLVAERNTSLGKIQLPSVRFSYEKQLITALEDCYKSTTDQTLKGKIRDWNNIKVQNFPLVWADVMQKSSELKIALSSNQGMLTGTDTDGLGPILNSLSYLTQMKKLDFGKPLNLESQLQQLQQNALPAKIWLSQNYLTTQFRQINQWLEHQQGNLNCRDGRPSKQVKYMANVLQRYFVEKIQPIASKLNHYHYQLLPIMNKLIEDPHLSPAFKDYLKQPTQKGFKEYQHLMKNHLQFWQSLFQRCNIQPGETF